MVAACSWFLAGWLAGGCAENRRAALSWKQRRRSSAGGDGANETPSLRVRRFEWVPIGASPSRKIEFRARLARLGCVGIPAPAVCTCIVRAEVHPVWPAANGRNDERKATVAADNKAKQKRHCTVYCLVCAFASTCARNRYGVYIQ